MSSSEPDYQFRSAPLTGPLSDRSELQRSLVLGELAYIAYLDEDSAQSTVRPLQLLETLFVEEDGAQAYVFKTEWDCIVACRGTEPTEWNDLKADVNATMAVAETVGRVHRGFKQEVDDLWPQLFKELEANRKTLWFTGHSLGGAMATICAGRCHQAKLDPAPMELHTFGSPRVGNKRFVNSVPLTHYRWVNNNDLVTRVPPMWLGYRHTGKLMYIDSNGQYGRVSKAQYAQDCWNGFWTGLKKGEFDLLADHSMTCYLDGIETGIRAEDDHSR
ncbi:lipase family protein [Thalassoglobus sp. JC818]|uniref:lipase family protein n=1 Tax=Thalassoglobus sp. JC818 TaxID=3232136 RepID=UPI00345A9D5E